MKRWKWIRRIVTVLLALGVTVAVGYFAATKYARQRVISVIEQIVDGPVTVDEVRLGHKQIEVRGIRVYESESREDAWLHIDRAVLGLAMWDAFRGETIPETALVDGANVILQFDEHNHLLSDFSHWERGIYMRLQSIEVRRASVEVRQHGRSPLVAGQISGEIHREDDEVVGRIDIGDALGSTWQLDARVNGTTFESQAQLTTSELRFSTDELKRLPFLPDGVGERSLATGITPVMLSVATQQDGELALRIALSPRSLDIHAKQLGLGISNASADIIVQHDKVSIQRFAGELLGAHVAVDGQLTRGEDAWTGKVTAGLQNLSVEQVPDDWQLPAALRGIISANADIDVRLSESDIALSGSARADVRSASYADIAADNVHAEVQLTSLRKTNASANWEIEGLAQASINVPELELAKLLDAADVDSDQSTSVNGRVTFNAAVKVPLATARDGKTYSGAAKLALRQLSFDGIPVGNLSSDLVLANGIATLQNAQVNLADDGVVTADGSVQLMPLGNLTASAQLASIPVARLRSFVKVASAWPEGEISGNIQVEVPIPAWRQVTSWRVTGELASDRLSLDERHLDDVRFPFDVRDAQLNFSNARASFQRAALRAGGTVNLAEPFMFSLDANVERLDVQRAAEAASIKLPVAVTGTATGSTKVNGELSPFSWRATGDVSASGMSVASVAVESLAATWQLDPRCLRVEAAKAQLLGGRLSMSGEVPLDQSEPISLSGTLENLVASQMVVLLPPLPFDIAGQISGRFHLRGIEDPDSATGSLEVSGLSPSLAGVELQGTTATVTLDHRQVSLKAAASFFSGNIKASATARLKPSFDGLTDISAHIDARAISLANAWQLVGGRLRIPPPQGVAHAQLDLKLVGQELAPQGSGRLQIHNVRWQGRTLTSNLDTRVELLSRSLVLRDLSFEFAGGQILSNVSLRLDKLGAGTFDLVANNLSIGRLMLLFPELVGDSSGSIDGGFRGTFADFRIGGVGTVRISSGRIAGIPVRGLETSIRGIYDLARRTGSADLKLTQGEISRGRATAEAKIEWGRSLSLSGQAKFTKVDLRPLARAAPLVSDQLTGLVSGNVALQGRDVRTLADLSGTYHLHLANSQLLRLPILSDLTAATGIGSPSSTFQAAEMIGRLNRGVVHLDRMTMAALSIHMFIKGQMTTKGQLDLEVTADAGDLIAVGVVTGVLQPLSWLRRRLLYFHIGGSVKSPVIIPQTEKFVQQEVLLFFLPFVAW